MVSKPYCSEGKRPLAARQPARLHSFPSASFAAVKDRDRGSAARYHRPAEWKGGELGGDRGVSLSWRACRQEPRERVAVCCVRVARDVFEGLRRIDQ